MSDAAPQQIPAPDYDLPAGYRHVYSGKVRDLYEDPDGRLLFVASDRISAYDWVLPTPIPDKGRILTAMSLWWFDRLSDIVENHVISTRVPDAVARRAMVCTKLDMFPVECVVRGYLAGSGLADYLAKGSICGNGLPPGLKDGSELRENDAWNTKIFPNHTFVNFGEPADFTFPLPDEDDTVIEIELLEADVSE